MYNNLPSKLLHDKRETERSEGGDWEKRERKKDSVGYVKNGEEKTRESISWLEHATCSFGASRGSLCNMKQKTLGSPAWLDPPPRGWIPPIPLQRKPPNLTHWVGGAGCWFTARKSPNWRQRNLDQGELSLSMPFWRGVQSSTQGRYVAS